MKLPTGQQLLLENQRRSENSRLGKTKTVVVIDDESTMRQMLTLILTAGGYQVVGEAINGQDGVTLCEKLKPDLVLLDINMPKMNGLLALEFIREQNPATKVIMVSVESKHIKVAEAIKRGASGFVVKPLNPASVLDRIESCFKGKV
jgi:two-component system chemotaxis response regulator CheY